jgi:acyl dehydratase
MRRMKSLHAARPRARHDRCMTPLTFDNLRERVGQPVGTSSWIEVPQSRIDAFADCTEDRQWIHIDVERARRESPFGAPVAHGFLTLALLPITTYELFAGLGAKKSVNYGMDKLRFIAPVKAGARVRNHVKLLSAEPREDGFWLIRTENTVEIEGEPKPALVAVSLGLFSPT